MNRLFFRPEQAGMTKTDAAADTLSGINPDVTLESYHMNITTLKGYESFKQSLTQQGQSRVDLVLSCVDNYEARMTINEVSHWKKATVLRSSLELIQVRKELQLFCLYNCSSYILPEMLIKVVSGKTACMRCQFLF